MMPLTDAVTARFPACLALAFAAALGFAGPARGGDPSEADKGSAALTEALERCRRAPGDLEARLALGQARRSAANERRRGGDAKAWREGLEAAVEDFKAAARLAKAWDQRPELRLTECLRALGEKAERLLEGYRRVYEIDPDSWRGALAAARYHELRGRVAEAISEYSRVIKQRPAEHELRVDRGELYRRERDAARALADADQVLKSEDRASARFLRARLRLESGEPVKARVDIDRGLELDRGSAYGRALTAAVLHQENRAEAALKACGEALSLDPDCAYAHLVRGRVLNQREPDSKAARAAFMTAARLAPQEPETLAWLGRLALKDGEAALALRAFDRAIARDSKNFKLYINRGIAKHRLGRLAEAVQDQDRAIALSPSSPTAHFQRAKARWVQLRQASTPYADPAWTAVLEDLGFALVEDAPTRSDAYGRRAYIQYKRARFKEALSDYDKAVGLGGDAVYLWHGYRSLVLTRLGRYTEALADAELFMKEAPARHPNRPAVARAAALASRALSQGR